MIAAIKLLHLAVTSDPHREATRITTRFDRRCHSRPRRVRAERVPGPRINCRKQQLKGISVDSIQFKNPPTPSSSVNWLRPFGPKPTFFVCLSFGAWPWALSPQQPPPWGYIIDWANVSQSENPEEINYDKFLTGILSAVSSSFPEESALTRPSIVNRRNANGLFLLLRGRSLTVPFTNEERDSR